MYAKYSYSCHFVLKITFNLPADAHGLSGNNKGSFKSETKANYKSKFSVSFGVNGLQYHLKISFLVHIVLTPV